MSGQSLRGRTALVTGGGAGLGRASALALAREGADVALLDINGAAAEESAGLVARVGVRSLAVAVDVSDGAAMAMALAQVRERLGAPLVVFSNAGIGTPPALFEHETYEGWRRHFAVHVDGTFHTVHGCLPAMVQARWGRIVCTSSVAATMGIRGTVAYSAAKGALLGFVRSLALEYATKGITVNAVAPGFIDTAMFRAVGEDAVSQVEASIPMKRQGQPEDIAAAVAYLCAESGRYMTGQIISPNGGVWFP
ncbi:MAG: SDR family oxidoreductase [Candidatus Lambdaproteobacteria bacterium]|nr:SDR family oxidoreductase [Candidatus Lambdaproteobacteria bacterium]